ncbi:hypothetical protein CF319_g6569 [Tilletia indica]|nr:hypothetical protein CF319_g6569 [Tilletia indica]
MSPEHTPTANEGSSARARAPGSATGLTRLLEASQSPSSPHPAAPPAAPTTFAPPAPPTTSTLAARMQMIPSPSKAPRTPGIFPSPGYTTSELLSTNTSYLPERLTHRPITTSAATTPSRYVLQGLGLG